MKLCSHRRVLLVSAVTFWLWLAAWGVNADSPVVRAVMFYSPTCPHCEKVISQDLPPLFEKYGDQLQIIGVNTANAGGSTLFNAACDKCNIAPEDRGVPLLVVADACLIGSADIPQRFPGLIEGFLAAGGMDWPEIPGLAEAIAQAQGGQPTATPATASSAAPALAAPTLVPSTASANAQPAPTPTPGILMTGESSDGIRERFNRDPIGNGLSVIVLIGMVAAFGWVVTQRPWRAWGPAASASPSWHDWAVPLLSIAGLGVAGYLAYVETQQIQAICGPVGDCNSVQQSDYALLFGLIPIGVLGAIGYLAILAAWAVSRFNSGRIGHWSGLALFAMTAGGVLFSIYLTFLEPFVIGATCAWCLSSAVIMTLLLLTMTAHASATRTGAKRGK